MTSRRTEKLDLREACVTEAIAIIRDRGIEALSLRDVARRLGVSHQAPYKHYPSREHLLAEIIARAFTGFALFLDARARHDDPFDDLREMGTAYLDYAMRRPLEYRLMFGATLPDPGEHPEMMKRARHAFDMLRQGIARLPQRKGAPAPRNVDGDALCVWSTLHGLASIMKSSAIATIDFAPEDMQALPAHVFERIRISLTH
jgi:AcrR family transcriptional regulator